MLLEQAALQHPRTALRRYSTLSRIRPPSDSSLNTRPNQTPKASQAIRPLLTRPPVTLNSQSLVLPPIASSPESEIMLLESVIRTLRLQVKTYKIQVVNQQSEIEGLRQELAAYKTAKSFNAPNLRIRTRNYHTYTGASQNADSSAPHPEIKVYQRKPKPDSDAASPLQHSPSAQESGLKPRLALNPIQEEEPAKGFDLCKSAPIIFSTLPPKTPKFPSRPFTPKKGNYAPAASQNSSGGKPESQISKPLPTGEGGNQAIKLPGLRLKKKKTVGSSLTGKSQQKKVVHKLKLKKKPPTAGSASGSFDFQLKPSRVITSSSLKRLAAEEEAAKKEETQRRRARRQEL